MEIFLLTVQIWMIFQNLKMSAVGKCLKIKFCHTLFQFYKIGVRILQEYRLIFIATIFKRGETVY